MHLQEVDHAVILTRKLSLCGAAARMYSTAGKEKIAMIGSGNFGSALVRILGRNALDKPETFDPKVSMYVHEEMIDGKPLTQIINETNENVKYLKGAKFTPNVKAVPDLKQAVQGAHVLVWVLPHQFIPRTAESVKDVIHPSAISVSMVKGGVDIAKDGLKLCSETIAEIVGHDVAVIMGANVANEVTRERGVGR